MAARDALETVRNAYDTLADSSARLITGVSPEAPQDLAMIGRFARVVIGAGGRRILDAGCGAGRMAGHLASLGLVDVEGVDLSPRMVDRAREQFPEASFRVAGLDSLPFGDGRFDGILAWYSIIHTAPEGLDAVFAGFLRVLRPGGWLLLGFQAGTGVRPIHRAYGHEVEFGAQLHDPADVGDRLRAAGFGVEASLRRGPRPGEPWPQGFVLARRPPARVREPGGR